MGGRRPACRGSRAGGLNTGQGQAGQQRGGPGAADMPAVRMERGLGDPIADPQTTAAPARGTARCCVPSTQPWGPYSRRCHLPPARRRPLLTRCATTCCRCRTWRTTRTLAATRRMTSPTLRVRRAAASELPRGARLLAPASLQTLTPFLCCAGPLCCRRRGGRCPQQAEPV